MRPEPQLTDRSCRDGAWVAVQVQASRERLAAAHIESRGYEMFLPLAAPSRRPRGSSPPALFPGYLFCRYRATHPFRIVDAPAVIRIVSTAGGPASIPEEEIDAIRRVVLSGRPADPHPVVHVGDQVRVRSGPLSGLEGTVLRLKNELRVVVGISLLQRFVAVELAGDELEPGRLASA
jgi:transcription antitermination factor NusG